MFISQLTMGNSGGRRGGISVLRGRSGLAQADNQVFDQFRKMSGTLPVAEQNVVELFTLFCLRQPLFDDTGNTALYLGHPLLFQLDGRFAVKHLLPDEVRQLPNGERFHDDFIGLEQDRGHGVLHVGVAAHEQC